MSELANNVFSMIVLIGGMLLVPGAVGAGAGRIKPLLGVPILLVLAGLTYIAIDLGISTNGAQGAWFGILIGLGSLAGFVLGTRFRLQSN
ncbi:MAG: hypothetical protein H7241_03600 [Novosphingobium sp.]|nr:hypothetical protein [Novosphingobium sp.]